MVDVCWVAHDTSIETFLHSIHLLICDAEFASKLIIMQKPPDICLHMFCRTQMMNSRIGLYAGPHRWNGAQRAKLTWNILKGANFRCQGCHLRSHGQLLEADLIAVHHIQNHSSPHAYSSAAVFRLCQACVLNVMTKCRQNRDFTPSYSLFEVSRGSSRGVFVRTSPVQDFPSAVVNAIVSQIYASYRKNQHTYEDHISRISSSKDLVACSLARNTPVDHIAASVVNARTCSFLSRHDHLKSILPSQLLFPITPWQAMLRKSLSPFQASLIIRGACNTWTTSSRYRGGDSRGTLGCIFGCSSNGSRETFGPGEDSLAHYICCPTLLGAVGHFLEVDLLRVSPLERLGYTLDIRLAKASACLTYSYHSMRRGGREHTLKGPSLALEIRAAVQAYLALSRETRCAHSTPDMRQMLLSHTNVQYCDLAQSIFIT